MTTFILALILFIPQADRADRELARVRAPQHHWLTWRHVMQVTSRWSDTRGIERAFAEANRSVEPQDPGARGTLVEQEALRRLAGDPAMIRNVIIAEVGGRHYVAAVGQEKASLGGKVVAEADLVRLKPGRTVTVGAEFDKSVVEAAWDFKTSRHPMENSQRARYRRVFGIEPIEVHSTSTWRAVGTAARQEAMGFATFLGGWLLKEGLVALETGDLSRAGRAVHQLSGSEFWRDAGVFTVAAKIAETAKVPGMLRTALPLAAGMAAVQLVSGRFSWREVLVGTAAYGAAGAGVGFVMDRLVYPTLFAAGPPGWIASGLYLVVRTGLALYAGEKLAAWLAQLGPQKNGEKDGLITQIRRME